MKVVKEMRYPLIRGQQCRVLPYSVKMSKIQSKGNSTVTSAEDTSCYVFVKGFLKERWIHSDLYNAFEAHGSIVSAKVSIDRHHISRGFGYV